MRRLRRTAGRGAGEVDRELVRSGLGSDGRGVDFGDELKRGLSARLEGEANEDMVREGEEAVPERPYGDDGLTDSPADLAEHGTSCPHS